MDSEHAALKRVDSRISPVAVVPWKGVFKESKGHWSKNGRGDTGGEEGDGDNGSVALVSSLSRRSRGWHMTRIQACRLTAGIQHIHIKGVKYTTVDSCSASPESH